MKRPAREIRHVPCYLPPTPRQIEILEFIYDRAMAGLAPTLREIGARFGIKSTNGIKDHLIALERKGLLEVASGAPKAASRGTVPTAKAFDLLNSTKVRREAWWGELNVEPDVIETVLRAARLHGWRKGA
jgi:SOS-response transcriptional repressor LexA